jgi:hypothetical protein
MLFELIGFTSGHFIVDGTLDILLFKLIRFTLNMPACMLYLQIFLRLEIIFIYSCKLVSLQNWSGITKVANAVTVYIKAYTNIYNNEFNRTVVEENLGQITFLIMNNSYIC